MFKFIAAWKCTQTRKSPGFIDWMRVEAREADPLPLPTPPIPSAPANSASGSSSPANLKPNDIEGKNGQSGDGNKRRVPVKQNEEQNPPCEGCAKVKRIFNMESGGGVCYPCVLKKSRCQYSRAKSFNGMILFPETTKVGVLWHRQQVKYLVVFSLGGFFMLYTKND